MWGINSPQPHFTLEGHEKGVNCVEYFAGGDAGRRTSDPFLTLLLRLGLFLLSGDRPYLVSGADDQTVKVWDYQTKQCVQTMEGHSHNVAAVCCHPELPIILSGSEDGTVRIWHAHTYRQEYNFNYAYERCWSIAALKGTNNVALAYDEGAAAVLQGSEQPLGAA